MQMSFLGQKKGGEATEATKRQRIGEKTMNQRNSGMRLAVSATFALQVIVSLAETKAETVLTNDVPRCAQTQEVGSDFFEKLESVETQICDALFSIHSCDVVHQKTRMPTKLISKGYVDMRLYLKKRQELLELLKAEAENKAIVKKTFLDPSLKTVKKHEPAGDTPTKGLPKDQPR